MATHHLSQSRLNEMKVYGKHGGWMLDLSQKNLARLPPALSNMVDLETLDLSDNPRLQKLPREFQVMSKLKKLSMLRCNIEEFPAPLCFMPVLENIRLSLNNIMAFPQSLAEMTNLQSLELVMCSLTELPACLVTLPSLKTLVLKCNKLKSNSFPYDMKKMGSLLELDISNNDLDHIPDPVTHLKALEVLKLSHNRIETLPSSIGKLAGSLLELHLSHNHLQSLRSELFSLDLLHTLYLDHNRLKVLSQMVCRLKELHDGENFSISHNRLVTPPQELCDQGLAAIKDFYGNPDIVF